MADTEQVKVGKRESDRIVKEAKKNLEYATKEWQEIRREGQKDMRYISGDPWDPEDRRERESAGRPCLSLDELNQYVNQIINEVRQQKRGIQIDPARYGATEKTANFRASLTRQIEYASHAQMAYTVAFENAVQRSYGFLKVVSEYENHRSFDQVLKLAPVPNPDLIFPDPDFVKTDGSDLRWLIEVEKFPRQKFEKDFPKAKLPTELSADIQAWITDETVLLANYWVVEHEDGLLRQFQLPDGSVEGYFDTPEELAKIPPGSKMLQERKVKVPYVCRYLTNGVEVLYKQPWPGKFIPYVMMLGKVLYVNDSGAGAKRKILSMPRLARDPYMLYCYYRTQQAEMASMVPKAPVMGYKGQFRGVEESWQKAPHVPLAFLEAEATTEGTGAQILPLPTRLEYNAADHIQALELAAEGARRAIQAAIGSTPLPSAAQRRNEKSGVALKQIDETAQKGSFHFIDHYEDGIRFAGVIIDDLIKHFYDTKRDLAVREEDGKPATVPINDPENPEAIDVGMGEHDVTISTGPSYDSEREQASEFADALVGSQAFQQIAQMKGPDVASKIFALTVRLKNLGPIGEQIADTIDPPEPEDGQQDPEQLKQQLQQAMQMLQQLTGELEAKTKVIETDAIKAQADMEKETMRQGAETERKQAEVESRERIESLKMIVQLTIAELGANSKMEETIAAEHAEITRQELGQEHEHNQNEAQRMAESDESEAGRAFEAEEAEKARQAELAEAESNRMFEADQAAQSQGFEAQQAEANRQAEAEASDDAG